MTIDETATDSGPPGPPGPPGQPGQPGPLQAGIRDRHVVLVATAIVALVLGLRLIGELIPGVDDVLAVAPLLIVALIVITVVVLFRALRPRHDASGD